MENKKKIIISMICAIIVITLGTSYALLRSNQVSSNPYTMNVGLLNITFKDNIHNLSLSNAYPMSDTDGMEQNDELIFTIKNTGELDALYNVYIEETSTSPEFKTKIRYASSKDNGVTYSDIKTLSENKYIEQNGLLEQNGEVTYNVKCWLDESADNTFMNKVFTAKIVVEALQKRNVVTFDANGGTVPIERKNVEYGEDYGELPTPTREGYEFLGWNGKNKYEIEWEAGWVSPANGNESNDEEAKKNNIRTNYIKLSSNKQYIFTLDEGKNYFPILYDFDKNYSRYLGMKIKSFSFSTNENEQYLRIMQYNDITIPNAQLEGGEEATEYEPYYITSDTKVVQNQDHTLKAIWKEN